MNFFLDDPYKYTEKNHSTRYYVKHMQPSNIFEALLAKEGKLSRKAWFKTTVKETRADTPTDRLELSPEAMERLRGEHIPANRKYADAIEAREFSERNVPK